MAGYSQQYTFGVNADTSKAQSQLDKLQQSLNQIQAKQFSVHIEDGRITEAANAAQQLQQQLQAAMNVKTGQLDLTKLNSNLAAAGTNVSKLSQSLLAAGSSGQQAFSNLSNTIAQAQAPTQNLSKAFTTLGTTLMNTIKWQAASSLVHGMMSSFNNAISYAKNLNSTLTDIRIVTGASSDEMARFATQANMAAKQLSTTTGEFAKASLIYYQQGDSAAEAAEKAAITTKAANIAFTASAQEMSQMLTAVWNSYKMGGAELEHAVDVMAKLGATTATSMEEISTGMQKVAATANTVGVSMEQMSSMIATSSSVTRQSAETVGTAWNTILSRITNLKLGETLEDGVDLSKYTKALQSIGVSALDATGNLREAGTLIDEIGDKWNTMNEAQKAAFAQTVGGVRQYTQIMAFFENFDKYQKNLKTAQNADGELQKQQDIYASGWEAASKRVRAALEDLYSQLLNDQAITKMTSVFGKLIEGFTQLTQSFGGAGNLIGLIVGQIASSHIDAFATRIAEIGTSIKELFSGNKNISAYAETLQNMQEQMSVLRDTTGLSQSAQTELDYNMQILAIKQKIAESQNTMTQQQKEQAELSIQQLQTARDFYTQQMKTVEETKKITDEKAKQSEESIYQKMAINGLYSGRKKDFDQDSWVNQRQAINEIKTTDIGGALLDGFLAAQGKTSTTELDNKILTDVDNLYGRLLQLREAFTGIKDDVNGLTVQSLIDSLKAAITDAESLKSILKGGNEAFLADGSSTWKATSYQGTAEQRYDYMMKLGNTVANSKGYGQLNEKDQEKFEQAFSDLKGLDGATAPIETLNNILETFQQTISKAGAAAESGGQEISNGLQQAGQSKADLDNIAEGARNVEQSVDDMATNAQARLEAFKAEFEKNLKGASATTKELVTTAMSLQRIVTAFNSISNLADTLNSDASAGQKLTAVMSTLVTVMMAANSLMTLLNSKTVIGATLHAASAAAAAAHAAGTGLLSSALIGATAAQEAFNTAVKSNPIGLIATAIAAAIVAIIALVKWLGTLKSAEEIAAEKRKETAKSFDDLKSAHEDTMSSLKNLADVVKDTNLTFEEQLSKITEITSALGLQVNAVDILTGRYSSLNNQMQEYLGQQFESNAQQAESLAHTYEQNMDIGSVGITSANDVDNMFTDIMIQRMLQSRLQSGLSNQNGAIMSEDGSIDFSNAYMLTNGIDEVLTIISNLNSELAEMGIHSTYLTDLISFLNGEYSEGGLTHFNSGRIGQNSNMAGFHGGDQGAYNTAEWFAKDYGLTENAVRMLFQEGILQAWDASSNEMLDSLEGVDFSTIQFQFADSFENVDWSHVSDLLYSGLEQNFTNAAEITSEQSTLGVMQTWAEANRTAANIMSSKNNANIDLLGVNGSIDLNTFNQMLENGEAFNQSFDVIMETMNLLSDVSSLSEAATQAQAVGEYAQTLVSGGLQFEFDESKFGDPTTQIYSMLSDYLDEHSELTYDQLITIRPTAIKIVGGKIEIDPSAQAVVDLKGTRTTLKAERANIEGLRDLKSDTLNADDIQTVIESGVFDTDSPEFREFITANKTRRSAMLDNLLETNQEAILAADRELITTLGTEEIPQIQTDLAAKRAELIEQWRDSELHDAFAEGVTEDEIVADAVSAYTRAQQKIDTEQRLFRMQNQDSSLWGEEDKIWLARQYNSNFYGTGKTIDAENVSSDTIAEIFNSDTFNESMEQARTVQTVLAGTVGQYTALEQAENEATTSLEEFNNEVDSSELEEKIVKPLKEAQTGAEGFAAAIGKSGKLDADSLQSLVDLSDEVLANYNQMSSSEWNRYAYEQARAHYQDLYNLSEGNLAKQIEIRQQMKELDETYYNNMVAENEKAYSAVQKKREEQHAAYKAAADELKDLSSGKTMFQDLDYSSIETLRQKLMEVYQDAERVDNIIKNLGKADEGDKEAILAAGRERINMLLSDIALTETQIDEYEALYTVNAQAGEYIIADGDQLKPDVATELDNGQITVDAIRGKNTESGDGIKPDVKDPDKPSDIEIGFTPGGNAKQQGNQIGIDIATPQGQNIEYTALAVADGTTLTGTTKFTVISPPEGGPIQFTATLTGEANGQEGAVGLSYDGAGNFTVSGISINEEGLEIPFIATITSDDLANQENGGFSYNNGILTFSGTVQTADGVTLYINTDLSEDGAIRIDEQGNLSIMGLNENNEQVALTTVKIGAILDPETSSFTIGEDGSLIFNTIGEDGVSLKITVDESNWPDILKMVKMMQKEGSEEFSLGIDDFEIFYKWVNETGELPSDELPKGPILVKYKFVNEDQASDIKEEVTDDVTSAIEESRANNPDIDVPEDLAERLTQTAINGATAKRIYAEAVSANFDIMQDAIKDFMVNGSITSFNGEYKLDLPIELNAEVQMSEESKTQVTQQLTDFYTDWIAPNTALSLDDFFETYIGSIVNQALKALESSDKATYEYGMYLALGLLQGWESISPSGYAEKGAEILAIIQASLAEASPSKATFVMGVNLMAGLQNGFDSVDFNASGLKGKVLDAIQSELTDLANDNTFAHLITDPLQEQIDTLLTQESQLRDQLQSGTGGEQEARKLIDLQSQVQDLKAQQAAELGFLGSSEYTSKEKRSKNQAFRQIERQLRGADNAYTQFDDYGNLQFVDPNTTHSKGAAHRQANRQLMEVNRNTGNSIRIIGNEEQGYQLKDIDTGIILEEVYDTVSSAYQAALMGIFVDEKTKDWLKTGIDESLDPVRAGMMEEAKKVALEKFNNSQTDGTYYDTWAEFVDAEGADTAIAYLEDAIDQAGLDLSNAAKTSWAEVQDSWKATLDACVAADETAAQQVYDIWKSTFEAIVAARKTIMENGILGDNMSENEIKGLVNGWMDNETGSFDADAMRRAMWAKPGEEGYLDVNDPRLGVPGYNNGAVSADAKALKYNLDGTLASDNTFADWATQRGANYREMAMGYWNEGQMVDSLPMQVYSKIAQQQGSTDGKIDMSAIDYEGLATELGVSVSDITAALQLGDSLLSAGIMTFDSTTEELYRLSDDATERYTQIVDDEVAKLTADSAANRATYRATVEQQMANDIAYQRSLMKMVSDQEAATQSRISTAEGTLEKVRSADGDFTKMPTQSELLALYQANEEFGLGLTFAGDAADGSLTLVSSSADDAAAALMRLAGAADASEQRTDQFRQAMADGWMNTTEEGGPERWSRQKSEKREVEQSFATEAEAMKWLKEHGNTDTLDQAWLAQQQGLRGTNVQRVEDLGNGMNLTTVTSEDIVFNESTQQYEVVRHITETENADSLEAVEGQYDSNVGDNEETAYNERFAELATAAGLTVQELSTLAEGIYDVGAAFKDTQGNFKKWEDLTKQERLQMAELASKCQQVQIGLQNLGKSGKEWSKSIQKGAKDNADYAKSMTSMKANLQKVYGDSKALTNKFVTDNLELIDKWLDGSEEAGQQIGLNLAQATAQGIADSITDAKIAECNEKLAKIGEEPIDMSGVQAAFNELDGLIANAQEQWNAMDEMTITPEMDDSGLIAALNAMLANFTITEQEANAILAAIGYEPNITTKTVEVASTGEGGSESSGSITQTATAQGEDGTHTQTTTAEYELSGESNDDENQTVEVPVIESVSKTGGGGQSAPSGGCFVAGTLIATINGYKNIEDICKDDVVLSYNEQLSQNEYSKVVQIMQHQIVEPVYTLYIDKDKLEVTGIHRFYINRNNMYSWIAAKDLIIQDLVLYADGTWHQIDNITKKFMATKVYNFEVSNNHNYYVGKNRILAHNKGGGCFEAGTYVAAYEGYKNIEEVQIGDKVLSYNEQTKQSEYSEVLETMIHNVIEQIYTLYIENDKLVVTGIHRFYILRNHVWQWIHASDLQIGDIVLYADGTRHKIQCITKSFKVITVYNFEVSNNHNYYVGKNQILAHNKGGGDRRRERRNRVHKTAQEKTRYHSTDRQMTIQGDKLSKLNKLKSFKYGSDYLNSLKQENKELSKQIALNQKKIKEAEKFRDADKQRLKDTATKGQKFEYIDKDGKLQTSTFKGVTAYFDEDDNLDFERYQDDMWDLYNAKIDEWNKLSGEAQEERQGEFDAWFDQWQQEMDTTVSNYEEAQDRIREAQQAILDNIATMSANTLESLTYTIELELDTTNFDRTYEDLVQKKLSKLSIFGEGGKSFAEQAQSIRTQIQTQLDDMTSYEQMGEEAAGKNTLYHRFRDQYASDEAFAQALADSSEFKKLQEKEAAGTLTADEKKRLKELKKANVTTDLADASTEWLTDADYQTALTQVRDGLISASSALEDLKASYDELYSQIWQKYDQDYQKFKTIMDHKNQLIDSYLGLLELMGEEDNYSLQVDLYKEKAKIGEGQNTSGQTVTMFGDITHAQDQLKLYEQQMEQFKARMNDKYGDGWDITQLSEQDKNDYLDLVQRINDAQDSVLTATQDTLQALRSMYEAQVNKIADEFEKSVVKMFNSAKEEGAAAITSIQDMVDEYAWYNEEQERYLNTSKSLYEVSKLNRQINNSLADMTTKASKERLVALQEEIKSKQRFNQLTEYDVNMLQKQYELALALDDLENAKNDKSTVRLVRDEEGNMGYQYTADEDKISEAQQKYEDVLQDINDLATDRVKELEQGYLDTMNEYYTKAKEIATVYADDETTRMAKLAELQQQYREKLQYYSQQYTNATGDLIENQRVIFENYGQTGKDTMQGINASMLELIGTTGDLNTTVASAMGAFTTGLNDAIQEYGSLIDSVQAQLEQSGTDGVSGFNYLLQQAGDYADEASRSTRDLNTALETQVASLSAAQAGWRTYEEGLRAAQRQAEETAAAIKRLKREAADEADPEEEENTKYHVIGTNPQTDRIEEYGSGRGYKKRTKAEDAKRRAENPGGWTGVVIAKYDTGGLADQTGPAWLDGTKNKPEYILNAEDTEKMFKAVDTVKAIDVDYVEDLLQALQIMAGSLVAGMSSLITTNYGGAISNSSQSIQQSIEINADFPNVVDQNEIVAAFNELSVLASQYVGKGQ